MLLEAHRLTAHSNLAGRIEALPAHVVARLPDEDRPHVHLALRQGARLVRADNGRGAERFHGGELPDEGVALHHPLEPESKTDRDDGGKAFRNRRNGEADRGEEEHLTWEM